MSDLINNTDELLDDDILIEDELLDDDLLEEELDEELEEEELEEDDLDGDSMTLASVSGKSDPGNKVKGDKNGRVRKLLMNTAEKPKAKKRPNRPLQRYDMLPRDKMMTMFFEFLRTHDEGRCEVPNVATARHIFIAVETFLKDNIIPKFSCTFMGMRLKQTSVKGRPNPVIPNVNNGETYTTAHVRIMLAGKTNITPKHTVKGAKQEDGSFVTENPDDQILIDEGNKIVEEFASRRKAKAPIHIRNQQAAKA